MTDKIDDFIRTFLTPKSQPHAVPVEPAEDVYPDIADSGFLPPDVDKPALPAVEPNITDLLVRIVNATEAIVPKDRPVYQTRIVTLNTNPGEMAIGIPQEFRHVFIPNVPRTVRVYAGYGRTFYLAEILSGQSLQATLPIRVNGVVLEWDNGNDAEQFTVYMSSEKLDVEITGDEPVLTDSTTADARGNNTYPAVVAFNRVFNGTSWDRVRGDITNGIDVDVTRQIGSPTVVVKATTVGVAAVAITAAEATRQRATIKNLGTAQIFVSSSASVTVANGFPVLPNETLMLETRATLYAISGTAGQDVRVISEI